MRSGNIVAIVVLIAVLIGGVIWFNGRSNQPEIASQPPVQSGGPGGDAQTVQSPESAAVTPEGEPEDSPIIVGDEVTDNSIVLESGTADAVILDPESSAPTVEMVTEGKPAEPAEAASGSEPQNDVASTLLDDDSSLVGDGAAAQVDNDPASRMVDTVTGEVTDLPSDSPSLTVTEDEVAEAETETSTTALQNIESADLLTPENFDRDSLLVLVAESDQLNEQQRSSLQALVEGAFANPEMRDGAIALIRSELGVQSTE